MNATVPGYSAGVRRLLLLDNEDSFVWNLAQAIQILGAGVDVVRSNRIDLSGIAARVPDAVVLSPGPGRPEQAGICIEAVRALAGRIPLLGVCLGHQAIGAAFGADVRRNPPCHGEATPIHHDGSRLFAGIPSPVPMARYHSLAVAEPPPPLRVTARDAHGAVMAIEHEAAAVFGVQFHPESFLSPHGQQLLANFLRSVG